MLTEIPHFAFRCIQVINKYFNILYDKLKHKWSCMKTVRKQTLDICVGKQACMSTKQDLYNRANMELVLESQRIYVKF